MTTKPKQAVKSTTVKKETTVKPAAIKTTKPVVVKTTKVKETPVKEVIKQEVKVVEVKPTPKPKPVVTKPVAKVKTTSPLTKEEKQESVKLTKMMNDNLDAGMPPGLLVTSGHLTIAKNVPSVGAARPSLANLFATGVLKTY